MRKPSIHIYIEDLIQLLAEELWVDGVPSKKFNSTIERVMAKAAKKAIPHRSISVSNQYMEKQMTRTVLSGKGDADLLANIIYSVRIKKRHRGVKQITQADRDWLQLKQLTKLCNQFCQEFNLEKREGYIKYIELGMAKISSMHSYISKLCNMYESICEEFDGQGELINDVNSTGTEELHDEYCSVIAAKTGIATSYINQPSKMLHFMRARELADELGMDYVDFIDAQFVALEFCNGIPNPESLHGDKAKERAAKYIYQYGITPKTQSLNPDVWKQFKKK